MLKLLFQANRKIDCTTPKLCKKVKYIINKGGMAIFRYEVVMGSNWSAIHNWKGLEMILFHSTSFSKIMILK